MSVSIQVAALLLLILAVGFGVSCLLVIRTLRAGRDLPIFMGFKAFGGGSFERRGRNAMVGLLAAFFLVCVLEAAAGWLLWGGHTSGAILALALVPIGAVFWWGFALPIPPMFAVARTILILVGWRSLR